MEISDAVGIRIREDLLVLWRLIQRLQSFCPFPKRIGIHHRTQFRPITLCDAVPLEAAKQFFHNEDLKNNSILRIFVKILSFLCCIFLKYC